MSRNLIAVVVCALALSISAAEAAPLTYCATDASYRSVCPGKTTRTTASRTGRAAYQESTIVDHPAGCSRRAFCGCGVSVKVFGRPVRDLFLAANWLRKFPRTEQRAGMVAAKNGHVFYILSDLGGGNVLAYDPNSGGGRTRVHVRSLAGYRVVDPHARVALR